MKHYSICQRNKSHGNFTWYGRIYENGLVRYESLKTKSKMVAKQWLDLMNSSRFLPENYFQKFEKKDKNLLDATNKFIDSTTARGNDLTTKSYCSRIKIFRTFCESKRITTLRAVTKEIAMDFNLFLAQNYQPKTHREILRCVTQFSTFCVDVFGLDDWKPFASIKKPKLVKRAKTFWTLEEISNILDNASDRHYRLLWSLMAYAGLRYAEAVSVNALSISNGRIRIIGKGNKEAFQPISDKLEKELERFGDVIDVSFGYPRYANNTMSCRALRKAVEEAGLDPSDATNHKFRHSFASNLIRAKVNIKAVQQLMRHESVDITLNTYTHLIQDDLTEAANAI